MTPQEFECKKLRPLLSKIPGHKCNGYRQIIEVCGIKKRLCFHQIKWWNNQMILLAKMYLH